MLLHGDVVTLRIKHNIEIAHRLFTLPGKCQQIHGHSMWVTLSIHAQRNADGYAMDNDGRLLEFGDLKKQFRTYLDTIWDHHLHLNANDPWAGPVTLDGDLMEHLPGLVVWEGDPSTENIAWWINEYVGANMLPHIPISVEIEETRTNGVSAP